MFFYADDDKKKSDCIRALQQFEETIVQKAERDTAQFHHNTEWMEKRAEQLDAIESRLLNHEKVRT